MVKYDDESGVGTVSITDYAQKSLGDVVFVELPETGVTIQKGGQYKQYSLRGKNVPDSIIPVVSPTHPRILSDPSLTTSNTDSVGAVESVKAASDIVRTG